MEFKQSYFSNKLGIHVRVCGYVMRLAAYEFSVFEYHALTQTHTYIKEYPPSLSLDFHIFRIRTRIRVDEFLAIHLAILFKFS